MDEKTIQDSKAIDAMGSLIWENRGSRDTSRILWDAGYRLDPYPNGKSKDDLLAIIATKQNQLDRARNFLRENHRAKISSLYAIDMEKHARINPDCPECKFLEETSNCPKMLELDDDGTTHEEVRS